MKAALSGHKSYPWRESKAEKASVEEEREKLADNISFPIL